MKKVLYVFDNINYLSGAQKVTLYQIQRLKKKYDISVFSFNKPNRGILSEDINLLGEDIWGMYEQFGTSLKNVLLDKRIPLIRKYSRIKYTLLSRLKMGERYLNNILGDTLKKSFENFDIVIVVSEASKLRGIVGELKNPKKIQWIHTDYAKWCEFSPWTKDITENDTSLYKKFDSIVLLSEFSKQNMAEKLPHLKDKLVVIPNLILGEDIVEKFKENSPIKVDNSLINIITVGRLEKEKNYDGILDICKRLKNDGIEYKWYIVGDGNLRNHLESRVKSENLEDRVTLVGNLENPISMMKECDWFVLLSKYEGTPVTIDEAKVIGLPVIALERGGIKEQLQNVYGFILEDDGDVYQRLVQNLMDKRVFPSEFNYIDANNEIETKIDSIFKGDM